MELAKIVLAELDGAPTATTSSLPEAKTKTVMLGNFDRVSPDWTLADSVSGAHEFNSASFFDVRAIKIYVTVAVAPALQVMVHERKHLTYASAIVAAADMFMQSVSFNPKEYMVPAYMYVRCVCVPVVVVFCTIADELVTHASAVPTQTNNAPHHL